MSQFKDSENFNILLRRVGDKMDITFRDVDGALTAHLDKNLVIEMAEFLLGHAKGMR